MTTRAAAAALGVGTTSIKRWADLGLLRCVKTPGGHRRYPRDAVEALGRPAPAATEPKVRAWLRVLLERDVDTIVPRLHAERARRRSWAGVADRLGPVIVELGRRWALGEISVLEEHIASDRLTRALGTCAASLPVEAGAPQALLVTAEGEEHTLGLSLLELALRERGWAVRWAGRRSPIAHVDAYLARYPEVRIVGVSASAAMTDPATLSAQAVVLERACRPRGVQLLLGGAGPWPSPPPYGAVIRSFAQLEAFVSRR